MRLTEFKFEWKVIFADHTPDITGIETVEGRMYWTAYMKAKYIISQRYENYDGCNVFIKRHQNEDDGARGY